MRFGFHVEHHLFPAMSSRHAPAVREVLRERWPDRYQSMPLWRALRAMHRSARVYRDDTTLIDPGTGQLWPLPPARSSGATKAREPWAARLISTPNRGA
jgi:fatty acid desaturase